jgi:tetratricopeptide (TPR) repeat protein
VFVTADRSILETVRREAAQLDSEGIPFFVRSPSDYLPFLNLLAMRDATLPSHGDEALRGQFQTVYSALAAALNWVVSESTTEPDGARLISSAHLDALQGAWFRTTSYATLLSVAYFYERAPRTFERLREFIEEPDASRAVTSLIEEAAVQVRNKQMALAVGGALSSLKRKQAESGEQVTRRVYLRLVGVRLPRLTGEQSISEFLENALDQGSVSAETVRRLESSSGASDSQFLGACLFMATERWQTALEFADRAERLLDVERPQGALAGEAAYLLALALRLSLETQGQFEKARHLLSRNLRYYRNHASIGLPNTLRRLRDEAELGSLLIATTVGHEIAQAEKRKSVEDDNEFFGGTRTIVQFYRGADILKQALDELRDSAPFDFSEREAGLIGNGRALVHSIELQALTNLCGAVVFESLLPGLKGVGSVADLFSDEDFKDLERLVHAETADARQFRHVDHVYLSSLAFLRESDGVAKQREARRIVDIIQKVDDNVVRLPRCDQVEFDFLKKHMERVLGIGKR